MRPWWRRPDARVRHAESRGTYRVMRVTRCATRCVVDVYPSCGRVTCFAGHAAAIQRLSAIVVTRATYQVLSHPGSVYAATTRRTAPTTRQPSRRRRRRLRTVIHPGVVFRLAPRYAQTFFGRSRLLPVTGLSRRLGAMSRIAPDWPPRAQGAAMRGVGSLAVDAPSGAAASPTAALDVLIACLVLLCVADIEIGRIARWLSAGSGAGPFESGPF